MGVPSLPAFFFFFLVFRLQQHRIQTQNNRTNTEVSNTGAEQRAKEEASAAVAGQEALAEQGSRPTNAQQQLFKAGSTEAQKGGRQDRQRTWWPAAP